MIYSKLIQAIFHLIALFFCAIFLFFACTEPDAIGENVLTSADIKEAPDTFQVRLRTFAGENYPSGERTYFTGIDAFSYPAYVDRQLGLLGSWNDPHTGRMDAGLFGSLSMIGTNLRFGKNPVADSIVLKLRHHMSYGNFNDPVALRIHEITQEFENGKTYYNEDRLEYDTKDLGNGITWLPKKVTSANINDTNFAQFKLDMALAERFLKADSSVYVNENSFRAFFKGLFLRAEENQQAGGGRLVSIDMIIPKPEVILFYKYDFDSTYTDNNGNPVTVTIRKRNNIAFPFASEKYQRYLKRSQTSSTLLEQLLKAPNDSQNDVSIVQSGLSVKTQVHISNLEGLKNRNINYAQIAFRPVIAPAGDTAQTPYPARLYLYFADDTTKGIEDSTAFSEAIYNRNTNEYVFVVTSHLQSIVMGRKKPYFVLRAMRYPFSDALVNRVFLGNFNHPDFRPKLRVLYTPKIE